MKDLESQILVGDCREMLRTLPDGCAQTCCTSPPYWGLRDYGVDGQIGLEESPDAFVATMVDVFREVRRVLADDGTLWLNLGDSYVTNPRGHGGAATSTLTGSSDSKRRQDRWESNGKSAHQRRIRGVANPQNATIDPKVKGRSHATMASRGLRTDVLKHKDLVGIPWMVAFALRADGWYLRSDIVWAKPNPMPESVTDRPTKSHEYLFLLSKSPTYCYDADAIREPHAEATIDRNRGTDRKSKGSDGLGMIASDNFAKRMPKRISHPIGANKRSVWTVATQPYDGAHFATFPPKLIEPCILAGSRVGDVVLDPFFGSGTTGMVAEKHARRWIGIDINPRYAELAAGRTVQRTLLG